MWATEMRDMRGTSKRARGTRGHKCACDTRSNHRDPQVALEARQEVAPPPPHHHHTTTTPPPHHHHHTTTTTPPPHHHHTTTQTWVADGGKFARCKQEGEMGIIGQT